MFLKITLWFNYSNASKIKFCECDSFFWMMFLDDIAVLGLLMDLDISTTNVPIPSTFYLFQMYQFPLLVLYWYAFSCCSTMGLIKLGLCLLQLSLFGCYLSVVWVYIISLTGTNKSSMRSPQYTCIDLWEILTLTVGDH